jgi:ubiquinone/menaquinone biosynthesis C-methylase UbiE
MSSRTRPRLFSKTKSLLNLTAAAAFLQHAVRAGAVSDPSLSTSDGNAAAAMEAAAAAEVLHAELTSLSHSLHRRHHAGKQGGDDDVEGDQVGASTSPSCHNDLSSLLRLRSPPAGVNNPQTRDAWIADFAKTVPAGSRVLDVSAGARPYKHLWSHCSYFSHEFPGNLDFVDTFRGEIAVSVNKKSLSELRKTHDFLGEVHNTTAPSASFDVVLLTEVLEHVPEPLLAIKELARVAKKGGQIVVTAPFTSGSHQRPYHFSAGYSPEFYRHAAKLYGLTVAEITSQGDFFKVVAQEVDRALSCGGGLVPGADEADVERLREIATSYLLRLSALFGDGSANKVGCADQCTIGWMVRYVKD